MSREKKEGAASRLASVWERGFYLRHLILVLCSLHDLHERLCGRSLVLWRRQNSFQEGAKFTPQPHGRTHDHKHSAPLCNDMTSSNVSLCVMWRRTHRNWHGLLDLFVAHQLNVSIFIVMNLGEWKAGFSSTIIPSLQQHTRAWKKNKLHVQF